MKSQVVTRNNQNWYILDNVDTKILLWVYSAFRLNSDFIHDQTRLGNRLLVTEKIFIMVQLRWTGLGNNDVATN